MLVVLQGTVPDFAPWYSLHGTMRGDRCGGLGKGGLLQ